MFLAHSFRLRDPWQCERVADGSTRWSRVFHRPTGLEPDDALWLVCSGLPAGALVSINNQRLTPPDHVGPNQFDVTAPGATGVPPVRPSDAVSMPSTGDTPVPPQRPNQFDVTALLADANRIDLEIPSDSSLPTAHCPPSISFPYDIRLGVVGHS